MAIITIPLPSILEDGVPDIAFAPETLRFMNNALYVDGLIPNITDNLKSSVDSGLDISVSAGGAIVNGTFVKSDSTTSLSITQGGASTRIDLVVIERDYLNRVSTIKIVEGVAGGGVPSLTQNDGGVWQYQLSKLTIPAGTLSLNSNMIENTALDMYAEDLQAIHKDKATNCILEAPTLMTNVGSTLTVPIGYKVLIPVGTKADGTIENEEHEVLSAITYSLPSTDGTYYIFIDKTDTITVSTSYNQQTNKAVIGKVVVASSVPSLTAYKPLEVLHTSNIAERLNTYGMSFVIKSYRSGSSWYRVWSDGFIEQGGEHAGLETRTDTSQNITFLIPFSDTNYCVQTTAITGNEHAVWGASALAKTKTGFSLHTFNQNEGAIKTANWTAKGY